MGPLAGFRIVEMAGIGPAPFAATLLADMGADVVRVDRREASDLGLPGRAPKFEVLQRGRRSVAVDLKSEAGRRIVRRLAEKADGLIEGFRPGVMERLGLGPGDLMDTNPRLVFGRMTGFGQDGPLAPRAGHDINYIALSGVLHAIGREGQAPVPPLNLVGDFGGGGMFLAFGIVCALLEAQKSGKGQVVDAGMVDGSAYLMNPTYGMFSQGNWQDERGVNMLDSGAPWYNVYETRDGKWLAVGAIEARFYREFLEGIGLAAEDIPKQHERSGWPELARLFAERIRTRTREEWEQVFAGSDACVAPVLAMGELADHPHNAARATFVERDGVLLAVPAPRLSRTPGELRAEPRTRGADGAAILSECGFSASEIEAWVASGAVHIPAEED